MVQSASGGFKLFGGREDKYQEASDLYIQAANAFRMQRAGESIFSPCKHLLLRRSRGGTKTI